MRSWTPLLFIIQNIFLPTCTKIDDLSTFQYQPFLNDTFQ